MMESKNITSEGKLGKAKRMLVWNNLKKTDGSIKQVRNSERRQGQKSDADN
jgi:hypothetical protein